MNDLKICNICLHAPYVSLLPRHGCHAAAPLARPVAPWALAADHLCHLQSAKFCQLLAVPRPCRRCTTVFLSSAAERFPFLLPQSKSSERLLGAVSRGLELWDRPIRMDLPSTVWPRVLSPLPRAHHRSGVLHRHNRRSLDRWRRCGPLRPVDRLRVGLDLVLRIRSCHCLCAGSSYLCFAPLCCGGSFERSHCGFCRALDGDQRCQGKSDVLLRLRRR